MRVLLDTQALCILSGAVDGAVPKRLQNILADPKTERLLSTVSLMEIASKSAKLGMSEQQSRQAVKDLVLTVIPFAAEHAYRVFSLPKHHKDPWDRLLIATALIENVPIAGGDRIFKKYKGLQILWK